MTKYYTTQSVPQFLVGMFAFAILLTLSCNKKFDVSRLYTGRDYARP